MAANQFLDLTTIAFIASQFRFYARILEYIQSTKDP